MNHAYWGSLGNGHSSHQGYSQKLGKSSQLHDDEVCVWGKI